MPFSPVKEEEEEAYGCEAEQVACSGGAEFLERKGQALEQKEATAASLLQLSAIGLPPPPKAKLPEPIA